MKKNQIIYWTTTAIISLMMLFSAYMYLTSPQMSEGFTHLGFPGYFRIELAIAKIVGAIVLLAPVSARFKEWGYAGFVITFISAIVAHTASDGVKTAIPPMVFTVLLLVSYFYYNKISAGITLNTNTEAKGGI